MGSTDAPNATAGLFFLHEEGPLDMAEAFTCAKKLLQWPEVDWLQHAGMEWDDHVPVNLAEHYGEMSILHQLRQHPLRTMDPMAAKIHYLGYAPLFAFNAEKAGCLRKGSTIAAALEGRVLMERYPHAAFVLMYTSWDSGPMRAFNDKNAFKRGLKIDGKSPPEWLGLFGHPRFYLATYDADFAQELNSSDPLHTIVVPYRSNYRLDSDRWKREWRAAAGMTNSHAVADDPEKQHQQYSFFFAGALGRRNHGKWRREIINAMEKSDPHATHLVHGISLTKSRVVLPWFVENETIAIIAESAADYLRSSTCLAPVGDTSTSRRLFEALAAGCVPVSLGDVGAVVRNLPFPHSVDWEAVMLFGGSMV